MLIAELTSRRFHQADLMDSRPSWWKLCGPVIGGEHPDKASRKGKGPCGAQRRASRLASANEFEIMSCGRSARTLLKRFPDLVTPVRWPHRG
jgi:hypothetical protein